MPAKGKQFFFPEDLPQSGKGSGLRNAIQDSGENMQQGWLFSPQEIKVSPKNYMTDEQRYPRGFNPRRQKEVEHALRNTKIKSEVDPNSPNAMNRAKREQASVKQVIARSGIPTDVLNEMNVSSITTGVSDLAKVNAAGLHTGSITDPKDPSVLRLKDMVDRGNNPGTNSDASRTLIHEVGHAVDRGRGQSKGYRGAIQQAAGGLARGWNEAESTRWAGHRTVTPNPRGKGITEGTADAISNTAFVPDRRAAPAGRGPISGYDSLLRRHTSGGFTDRVKAREKAAGYAGVESRNPIKRQIQGKQWIEGYKAARNNEVRLGNMDTIKPSPVQGELF